MDINRFGFSGWMTLFATIAPIMGIATAIGLLKESTNERLKHIFKIIGKVLANLAYVALTTYLICNEQYSPVITFVFGAVGFITCWVLINWAMNGGIQKWLKKHED